MKRFFDNLLDISFFFFVIGIYFFSSIEGYNYITNIFAFLFIVSSILNILKYKKQLKINFQLILFACFIGICLFTSIKSININYAFSKCTTLIVLWMFSLCLLNYIENEKKIKYILKSFLLAGFISGVNIIFQIDKTNSERLGSNLGNVNEVGILIAISALIYVFFVVYEKRNIYIVGLIITGSSVLLTGSRTSLLLLIIGSLIILFLKSKNSIIKIIFTVIIMGIILYILYYFIMNNEILYQILGRRIESFTKMFTGEGGVDNSAITRTSMIIKGLELFAEKPLIGIGMENFRYLSGFGTYSHSNVIEILCSTGILGFIVYYGNILITLIQLTWRKTVYKSLFISIIFVLAGLSIISVQFHQKYVYIFLILGSVIQVCEENIGGDFSETIDSDRL